MDSIPSGDSARDDAPGTASIGRRDPLLLAAVSAVVAGAGQWLAGSRRRAWLFFGPLALAILLAGLAATRGIGFLFDLFVRPGFLWWLLVANLFLLMVRLAAVVDAYRLGRWRTASRWSRMFLIAVVVVVAAPHAVVASHSIDAIGVLDTVFIGDEVPDQSARIDDLLAAGFTDDDLGPTLSTFPAEPPPTIPQAPTVPQAPTIPPVPTPAPSGPPLATTAPVPTVEPSRDSDNFDDRDPELFDQSVFGSDQLSDGRITILLAGGDAGPGRSGLRTDVMIVATLDLENGGAALFGLPRNLTMVPLPPEFDEAFLDLEQEFWERELAATTTTTTTTTTSTTTTSTTTSSTTPPTTNSTTTLVPTTTTISTTTTSTTTSSTTPPTTNSTTTLVPTTTTTLPPTTTTVPPTTTTTLPPFVTCECYPDMLNSIHARSRNWVRTFPEAVDPGMETLRRTISHLIGLEIDYYVLVDMAGFVALIDALDGVDVYFDEPMHIAFSPAEQGGEKALINVDVGMNHLTGLETLAYVRNRYSSSDYVRMERQRCLLRSVAAEADLFTLVRSFSEIADALRDSTRSNIPVELLPDLFRHVARLDPGEILTQSFQPNFYAPDRDFLRRPIPDPERIRQKVSSMLGEIGQASAATVSEPSDSECDG